MELTTRRKLQAESDAAIRDDVYKQRDRECRQLEEQFFAWIGMGLDDEYVELEDGRFNKSAEQLKAEAATIAGWVIWTGEEYMRVWKDGVEVGSTMFCCRGGAYGAECTVGDKQYVADDATGGVWQGIE